MFNITTKSKWEIMQYAFHTKWTTTSILTAFGDICMSKSGVIKEWSEQDKNFTVLSWIYKTIKTLIM